MVVRMTKDGNLQIGNNILNLDELLVKLSKTSNTYIQDKPPTDFKIGDWWYNFGKDKLYFARLYKNTKQWFEVPFGKTVDE